MFSENRVSTLAWAWRSALKGVGLAAVGLSALAIPQVSQGATIIAGYDLFSTGHHAASFLGVAFNGSPLESFDFNPSSSNFDATDPRNPAYVDPDPPNNPPITLGIYGVGNTDTIVQRFDDVTTPGLTNIRMLAIQLVTANPVDLGGGIGTYYATLNSTIPLLLLGGTPAHCGNGLNPNTMQINGATFSSCLDFYVDFRLGSPTNPVVSSAEVIMTAINQSWSNSAPNDALKINDVNHLLNGSDTTNDFWPGARSIEQLTWYRLGTGTPCDPISNPTCTWTSFREAPPNIDHHIVDPATPEIDAASGTGALSLLAGGLALVGERRRRKAA